MSDEILDEVVEDDYIPRAHFSFSQGCWVGGVDGDGFDQCPAILSPDEIDNISRNSDRGHYRESDMAAALSAWKKRQEIASVIAEADEVDEDTIWLSR